ncbi:MAG: hypothetical protein JWO70_642 [Betaproteobacteria bacterium]|nr:hypothetical protein [Betaproteobacteria bacterium]
MDSIEVKYPAARKSRLIQRQLDGELLVYDTASNKAHCLNDTAARVWNACDGRTSVPQIAAHLSIDAAIAVDEQTVWLALAHLEKTQLLDEPVVPPELLQQIGRRNAVRTLALASVVAVPFITSILAPTPAQAASGKPPP